MFRRRRGRHGRRSTQDLHVYGPDPDDVDDLEDAAEFEGSAALEGSRESAGSEVPEDRPTGPWDLDEPASDIERVDLGALRVPTWPDLEVHVTMADSHVITAIVLHGESALQVRAFAAPKSTGIWDDVRQEIVRDLEDAGGGAEEVAGEFGTELLGRVPTEDHGSVPQPARFVGVDGPRWLLQGTFTGPAAESADSARRLEEVFRGIVVVRGDAPMPPQTPLELRLPQEAQQAG